MGGKNKLSDRFGPFRKELDNVFTMLCGLKSTEDFGTLQTKLGRLYGNNDRTRANGYRVSRVKVDDGRRATGGEDRVTVKEQVFF